MTEAFKNAIAAALEAGKEILKIYKKDFVVDFKNDESPLTIADIISHDILVKELEKTNIPVLSEEGKVPDYKERKKWKEFWLIDPLDGTKEFVKKNGEFTVNIAYLKNNIPVFGVVYAPVIGKLYYGGTAMIPMLISDTYNKRALVKKNTQTSTKAIVASKSHLNKETESFIKKYPNHKNISMGSSLKFMLLAEQKAVLYPRFAPTMEWDTAAAHAILKGIGYSIKQKNGKELSYNKENLQNPSFLAE